MSQALRELAVSIDFNDIDIGRITQLDRAIDGVQDNVMGLGRDADRMGDRIHRAGDEGSRALNELGDRADLAGNDLRDMGRDGTRAGDQIERGAEDATRELRDLGNAGDRAGEDIRDASRRAEDALRDLGNRGDQAIDEITRSADRAEDALRELGNDGDRALDEITSSADRAEDAINEIGDASSEAGNRSESAFDRIVDALREIAPQSRAGGAAAALFTNPWILGTIAVVGAIAGIGIAIASMVGGADADFKKMQAQLGYTSDQMEGMKDTALDVYAQGFGADLSEVTNDTRIMKQNFKDLSDESVGALTSGAYTLKELFGPEVKETSKVVKTMTANFKDLSEQDAMDLITTGFQKGGDYADDFMDTVNEYSVYFNKMGVSADKFVGTLIKGGEAGAFNVDKIGDAFKEVGIRAMDGSDATKEAFSDLGFDPTKMGQDFAQGGEKAEQALMATVAALSFVEDKQKQAEIGVKLFGTQWEDMREDVIFAIDGAEDAVAGFEGATSRATETMQDTIGAKWTKITRGFKSEIIDAFSGSGGAIGDLLDSVLEFMPQIVGGIQSAMDWITNIYAENKETFDQYAQGVKDLFYGLSETIQAVWGYIGPFISSVFSGALGVVWSTAGTVLSLVGGIFKGFGQLITGDWSGLWTTVKSTFDGALNGLLEIGRSLLDLLFGVFDSTFGRIIEFVSGIDLTETGRNMIDGLINGVKAMKDSAIETVKGVAQGMWDGVKSFFGIASPSKLMAQAGQWIIEGLKKGVLDRAADAIESIKSVAKSMWDGVTNFFGIHSPSRLMAETGNFVVEGLEVGITDNAYKALGAAQDVSKGVASVMGETPEIGGILAVRGGKARTSKELEGLLTPTKPNYPQPEPDDGYARYDGTTGKGNSNNGVAPVVSIDTVNVNIPAGTNVNDPAALGEVVQRLLQQELSKFFSNMKLATGE